MKYDRPGNQNSFKVIFNVIIFVVLIWGIGFYLIQKNKNGLSIYKYSLPNVKIETDIIEKISYTEDLEKFLSENSNVQDLNDIAELLFNKFRNTNNTLYIDKSLKVLNKSLQIQPQQNNTATILKAKIFESQHRFEEAIVLATTALNGRSETYDAYQVIVYSNLSLGLMTKAQAWADIYVQKYPKTKSLSARGLVLIESGRIDEGVFDLNRAIKLEDLGEQSDSAWVRCILARHFISVGRLKEADYLLNQALAISKDYAFALDLLGQIAAVNGDYKKAKTYFEKAFSLTKELTYLIHTAVLEKIFGKTESANNIYKIAESLTRNDLKSNSYGHRLDLVKILLRTASKENLDEALTLLQEEEKIRSSAVVYQAFSEVYAEKKNWPQALEYAQRILRTGSQKPEHYLLLEKIYRNLGQADRGDLYMSLITMPLDQADIIKAFR